MFILIVLQPRHKFRLVMNGRLSPLLTHLHLQSQCRTCDKRNLRELMNLGNAFNGQVSMVKSQSLQYTIHLLQVIVIVKLFLTTTAI